MGKVIGDILPQAVAVAISCVPIVGMILILFSERAKINSLALLLGWVAGLSAVTAIVYVLAIQANLKPHSGPSTAVEIVKLAFGVLFLAIAVSYWFKRPKKGDEPAMPKWMSAIDRLKPGMALVFGIGLGVLNVKNLPLTIAVALTVAKAHLGTSNSIVVFAIFIAIGSIGVAAPAIAYLVAGKRVSKPLDVTKAWLIENNATVMMVVFLILAAVLIGKGIAGLAS
jgi:hypothetical protein